MSDARSSADGGAATDRAERLVNDWGEQLGRWAGRTVARVREEAEDLWAEAQAIRHGGGPPAGSGGQPTP